MRIGILTHNYPRRHTERKDASVFLYDFAHDLAKKTPVFIFSPNFAGEKESYKDVPVTWFKWGGGSRKLGSFSPFNPASLVHFFNLIRNGNSEVIKFVKENRIDFCLAAWVLPSGVFAREAHRQLGTPYATWSLGSDLNQYARFPILRQLIKNAMVEAQVRFANSLSLCHKVKLLTGLECEFLPAITRFSFQKTKSQRRRSDDFIFLFVGRLERIKGPDILIESCGLLKQKTQKFSVFLIGEGNMREQLRRRILTLGLEDKVHLLGGGDKTKVATYMLGADSLIIPSRNESLPLVLIEASKAGLPIIATDVGDCAHWVNGYNIGFIVNRNQPEGLAEAMLKAIKEGKSFKEERRDGLSLVAKKFNQKEAVDLFLGVVSNSLSKC